MKPEKFKHANVVYGENQPEYLPLPAHRDSAGVVTTFWKCSTLRERIRMFFQGGVYVSLMTFNKPIQPSLVMTEFSPPTEPIK